MCFLFFSLLRYRLHRALSVAMQTGGGSVAALPPPADEGGLDAFRSSLDWRPFFLSAPRAPLCRQIDARCEQMLAGGLLEEARSSTFCLKKWHLLHLLS